MLVSEREVIVVSDDTRKTIDALSKEELRQEINKKSRSRFQRDKYAYLRTRLASLEEQELQAQRQEEVAHKQSEAQEQQVNPWPAIVVSLFELDADDVW